MRVAALALLIAGCAEPVVEMKLEVPAEAERYNTSCITAVEARAIGSTFAQTASDFTRSCIDISNQPTYAAIREAIHGKFTLDIPATGLAGVAVFGWAGVDPCAQSDSDPFVTPDLVFFARGDYLGQDSVAVQSVANVNCTRSPVKVRFVDVFGLVASGSTAGCAAASSATTFPDSISGGSMGTLTGKVFGTGLRYYGGASGGKSISGVVSVDGLTEVGPKSCLAFDGGSDNFGGSTGCLVTGNVCADAGAGEREHAMIVDKVIQATPSFDPTLMARFPGVVFGSVWSNGATKAPLPSATVEVDPAHGKVIYIDPPDVNGVVKARADQNATGPSGLFMLFADSLVDAKISAAGKSRSVTLGATGDAPAGALIVAP